MPPKNIFDEEESIIKIARSYMTLEDNIDSPLFPHFSDLLASYIKLSKQLKRIVKFNDKQNIKLSTLNKEMAHILNYIPVGIAIIDADGLIQPAYSKYMEQLFPHEKKFTSKHIENVLFWEEHLEKDRETFRNWLKLVFDTKYDWDLIKDLGPDVVKHGENGDSIYYQNTYHRVIHENNEIFLIIHITDITEKTRQKIALEEQAASYNFDVEILTYIVDHEYNTEIIDFINDTKRLIQDAKDVFNSLAGSDEKLIVYNHLYRHIHSIKGLSGVYGINAFINLANKGEDILSLFRTKEITFESGLFNGKLASEELFKVIETMATYMDHAETIIRKIFTQVKETAAAIRMKRRGLKVDTEKLKVAIKKLQSLKSDSNQDTSTLKDNIGHVISEIISLTLQPIDVVYNRFKHIVKDVAFSLEKEAEIIFEGDQIFLDPDRHHLIITALIHLLRNSLDHGLETPKERIDSGKNRSGAIRLTTKQSDGTNFIEFSDDGLGMDPFTIAEKAAEKGLVTREKLVSMSDQEKINLILLPGFTSKSKVTNLSGRGVGMDTVVDNVKQLGGTVTISTEKGKGTSFLITFPSKSQ